MAASAEIDDGEGTAMARNRVQFQKGLSEAAFEELYGTEDKCRAVVMASRWPNGFECPACGGRAYSEVTTRRLFQCSACRHQTSLTAGTSSPPPICRCACGSVPCIT